MQIASSSFRKGTKNKANTFENNSVVNYYKSDKSQADMLTSMPSSFFNDPDFMNKYINMK